MECPVNKKECPCTEYEKDGLCDYPYRKKTQNDQVFISQMGFVDAKVVKEQ